MYGDEYPIDGSRHQPLKGGGAPKRNPNRVPINVKELVLKALFGRFGWLLKLVTSTVMGGLTYLVVGLLKVDVSPEALTQITEGVGFGVFIALQWVLLRINLTATEAIQQRVREFDPEVDPDRWLGPVTTDAVIRASEIAKNRIYKADVVE